MKETVIIGIGNILYKDDGVGIHVVNALEKEGLPSTIELVDGGTSTIYMLDYITEFKKVIVVDSLKAGLEPGTIYKIRPEDIEHFKKENLSIHDVQILDVFKMAKLMGSNPDVTIIGIEPEDIKLDLEVSDKMKQTIPAVIKFIKQELMLSC